MYGIKEIPIRIFSGVFFSTGRESESDLGVMDNGRKWRNLFRNKKR